MTEIKIEKKKTIWPWVLVAFLLLALLLYFLVFRDKEVEGGTVVGSDTTQNDAGAYNNTNDGAVAEYVNYVNGEASMGPDHEYTGTAIEKLASAIRAKSEAVGYDLNTELDQATSLADKIRRDASATTHSSSIREAASVLTTAMGNLQQAKYPGLNNEMNAVRQASTGISGDTQTLNQKESVKSFFQEAGQLLQKMD